MNICLIKIKFVLRNFTTITEMLTAQLKILYINSMIPTLRLGNVEIALQDVSPVIGLCKIVTHALLVTRDII